MNATLTTVPLADRVLDLLVVEFDAPPGTTADTPYDSLGFDSLILVELAVALGAEYGVEMTDDEVREAGDVTRTVEVLRSKGITA